MPKFASSRSSPGSAIPQKPSAEQRPGGGAVLRAALERSGTAAVVDLAAVQANYRILRRRTGSTCEVAGVLKADAYGLGAQRIAAALAGAGCRTFFTATPAEGDALLAAVPEAAVHVLAGGAGFSADTRLIPVLNHPGDTDRCQAVAARAGQSLPVAIHVDTGMNRLGYSAADWHRFSTDRDLRAGLEIQTVMSHLAVAELPDHPRNAAQLARFQAVRRRALFAPRASLANSSGIWLSPDFHFDLARAGASLFGINPTPGRPNPVQAVARLIGCIHQVRSIDRGEGVGYGHTWVSPNVRRIATVSSGYADGYPRQLGNAGRVAIGDHVAPVVGRISMDLVTVDVTGVPEHVARPGALVDLLGPRVPVDDVALDAGTIGYEILARIGSRVPRVYVN